MGKDKEPTEEIGRLIVDWIKVHTLTASNISQGVDIDHQNHNNSITDMSIGRQRWGKDRRIH